LLTFDFGRLNVDPGRQVCLGSIAGRLAGFLGMKPDGARLGLAAE
jgi:hypothetical protein